MLIKNVLPHLDDLHDGRPIAAYATAEISQEAFALEHYQSRLRDGLIVVVDEAKALKPTATVGAAKASTDANEEAS